VKRFNYVNVNSGERVTKKTIRTTRCPRRSSRSRRMIRTEKSGGKCRYTRRRNEFSLQMEQKFPYYFSLAEITEAVVLPANEDTQEWINFHVDYFLQVASAVFEMIKPFCTWEQMTSEEVRYEEVSAVDYIQARLAEATKLLRNPQLFPT